jgi:5-methylcytosine-specific restriction endonuclease McrA
MSERERQRELARARRQRWIARNPEGMRAARRKWKLANPEKLRADRARQKRRRPEMNANQVQRLKAKRYGVQVLSFTGDQLRARMAYYGHNCWICGYPADTMDHVKPPRHGGPHMLSNLRPACRSCNTAKHNHWPIDIQRLRLRGMLESPSA